MGKLKKNFNNISFSTIKKIIYIFMLTVGYFPRLFDVIRAGVRGPLERGPYHKGSLHQRTFILTYLNVSLQLTVGVEVMLTNQLCRFFYFF